jgi:hypothetical protein
MEDISKFIKRHCHTCKEYDFGFESTAREKISVTSDDMEYVVETFFCSKLVKIVFQVRNRQSRSEAR